MKDKVKIIISKGNYADSLGGKEYISVKYDARRYGGASPCDNETEIRDAIKHAKQTIKNEGDIHLIEDTRNIILTKQTTLK